MSRIVVLAWILCLFPAAVSLGAELRLAAVFGDHMVLQRDKPVCVWGHAVADAHVSVRFAGQEQTTRADGGGHWKIHLAAQPASAQGQDLVVTSDGESVTVSDVLVGEVWLLGGQSNMEMPLWWRADGKQSAEGTRLVLETDHPWLRVMTVTQAAARHPQETFGESVRDGDDVQTLQWRVSKSKDHTISGFSALGYYIALELYAQLGVPIGLIDTSWGGTIAAAWNSRESLESIPEARKLLDLRDAAADAWSEAGAREKLRVELEAWEKLAAAAKAENKPAPTRPTLQPDPALDRNFPAGPFHAMIWPLRHMTLRGVFFYQGENNFFDRVDPFAKTYPGVVRSWRRAFGEENLPFCLFQISGWDQMDRLYWQTRMPLIQVDQLVAHASLPNTGFVVTSDYPHADIHPMRKRPIAERAVRWARSAVYGQPDVTWGTPVLESSRVEGQRMRLTFRVPGNEPLKITGTPAGFVIAGADRKFVEAKAEQVAPGTIEVWSDQVTEPAAVRYVWSQRGIYRVYTESGLPLGPFRTDDWVIPESEIHD